MPGKSHGRRSLVGCSPWGREESHMTERLHFHFSLSIIGEGNGNPLQCSCLENPRDWGAWWAAVHGVAKSQTGLSVFTFTFHFPALEKEMATHSSVLAWRIPGTGEPGGLPSMGSHSWTRLKRLSSSSSILVFTHYTVNHSIHPPVFSRIEFSLKAQHSMSIPTDLFQ